ncbi:MAG: excinuclease ABC subunit UvrC [Pseudomonadota bacterium]|nr:excinuclease ABC subunit UvrC [Desulfobacterales bacterium]
MKPQADSESLVSGIQEKLSRVSRGPGVYIMKDVCDNVIYVGKARNLKKRLASYFSGFDSSPRQLDMKTGILLKKIADFDTILTRTEKEALILESNLIKRHKPRYNVILKDDKRYPSLRLDIKNGYPDLTVARKLEKDGALYFGPYASASAVRQTLKIVHKTFQLRKCKRKSFQNRTRPCLNYQIGACLAPCCLDVDQIKYQEVVKEVILFLNGKTPELIQKIKKEMVAAAAMQDFEKAAVFRDKMFALEKILEKQVAVTTDFMDRDVLAVARTAGSALITLLVVRGGFLLGTRHFSFPETIATEAEMIGTFIRQYYEKIPFVPKEILVPISIEDVSLLAELLSDIKGQKVRILRPQRGEKARLVNMAIQNAENSLKDITASELIDRDLLAGLQQRLKLNRLPERIECIDNSNISGKEAVAAVVVFEKAKPMTSAYRRFRIKTVAAHNDYGYLTEVMQRRFGKGEKSKPYPDILLVDGGKGQLNIAVAVLKELKLDGKFEILSIAKKDEKKGETLDKIYRPGQANPVNLGREGHLLLFLQRIRDEAHRFAISFHRKRRSMTFMHSVLDTIPGIGPKRKKVLLKHFGSINRIRAATLEELSAVPGMNRKVAENIITRLAHEELI